MLAFVYSVSAKKPVKIKDPAGHFVQPDTDLG